MFSPPPSAFSQSQQRDIARFMKADHADPDQDLELGGLLLKSFTQTNRVKSPDFATNDDRILELLDIEARRQCGAVRVLEFGKRIVGTYSLMRPHSKENLSMHKDAAHLRCLAVDTEFQGLGLSEILMADMVQIAQSWEVRQVILEIFRGSVGLAKFYSRHGFERFPGGDYSKGLLTFEAYLLTL